MWSCVSLSPRLWRLYRSLRQWNKVCLWQKRTTKKGKQPCELVLMTSKQAVRKIPLTHTNCLFMSRKYVHCYVFLCRLPQYHSWVTASRMEPIDSWKCLFLTTAENRRIPSVYLIQTHMAEYTSPVEVQ